MDQQKKTTSGALQAPLTAPTNNLTIGSQALFHNPGASQALTNNSGAAEAAQAFLGNRGTTYQPLLNNTYVGQQHMGVPGASISKLSTGTTQAQTKMEEKALQVNHIAMLEALTYTIDRIASEAFGDSDKHATTTAIFNLLSSYTWDAKLVLSLSAFTLNYGEFWLLAQIYSTNQLAKSMTILRQFPSLLEHTAPLKPRFDVLNNLIWVMIDVTKCVVQFTQLPSTYISQDVPVLVTTMNLFPTTVYWTIRSMVACATQISNLSSMGHEFGISTTELWELSTLAHKLRNIYELLSDELAILEQIYNKSMIHEKRLESQYEVVWIPIVDHSIIPLPE
ncbi:hypothetical protein PVK06_011094 [Gossypium arboreum]|uniref:Sieve element occlusion N-terminal domain-containing protein n=1 Tax=Gossypium arboreum TaxID=29729 RepID=A0ABR0Q842_GOSAR|nr:hypothetical protein PVK06_011094 [Gossypium arboreum]